MRTVLIASLALACSSPPDEDLLDTEGVWSDAVRYDVAEAITFTTEDYGLTGTGTTIGDLKDEVLPTGGETLYAEGDEYGVACSQADTTSDLPVEIEGVVTLHPRWYMKLSGCDFADEKYYGNYFIEDDSAGIFVVGDSKVAHFDVGDRIRLKVRAVRTNFEFDMIYVHDVLEVHREARPIKYSVVEPGGLGRDDIGQVRRVRGEMVTEPDTFGQFTVLTEDGDRVSVNLDSELNRRRQYPAVGTTLCATGPVQYSFSEYSIVIMKIGQLAVVEAGEACPDVPETD